MKQATTRKIPISARITPSTYHTLERIADTTKIKISKQVEHALKLYIQNLPEDLPLELQIEIARAKMQEKIDTIKNILWTYHKLRDANIRLQNIAKELWIPPHAQSIIQKLETDIIADQQQLDNLLRKLYNQRDDRQ